MWLSRGWRPIHGSEDVRPLECLFWRDNGGMAIVSRGFVNQERIADGVAKAAAALATEVAWIRYELREDWSGEDALFFRIVLKDSASDLATIGEVSERVREELYSDVQPLELGLQPYFRFRSESEQRQLKDKAWK